MNTIAERALLCVVGAAVGGFIGYKSASHETNSSQSKHNGQGGQTEVSSALLSEDKARYERKMHDLQTELNKSQAEVDKLKHVQTPSDDKILKKQNWDLKETVKEQGYRLDGYKTVEAQLENQRVAKKNLEFELDQLKKKFAQKSQEDKILQNSTIQAKQTVQKVNKELEDANKRYQTVVLDNVKLKNQLHALNRQLEGVKQSVIDEERKTAQTASELVKLKKVVAEFEAYKAEQATVHKQLTSLKETFSHKTIDHENLAKLLATKQEEITKLKSHIQSEMDLHKNCKESLQAVIKQLNEAKTELEIETTKLHIGKSAVEQALNLADTKINQLQRQLNDLRKQLN